jgi:hypothetical protein
MILQITESWRAKKSQAMHKILEIMAIEIPKKDAISPGKARTFNLLMCNQAGNADNSQTR